MTQEKMPATARLSMQGIRKTFGPTIALGHVDLAVLPGEVHAWWAKMVLVKAR